MLEGIMEQLAQEVILPIEADVNLTPAHQFRVNLFITDVERYWPNHARFPSDRPRVEVLASCVQLFDPKIPQRNAESFATLPLVGDLFSHNILTSLASQTAQRYIHSSEYDREAGYVEMIFVRSKDRGLEAKIKQ